VPLPLAPRCGLEHLPDEWRYRFTFCCDRDGCRKRVTPPSVRFLDRKVYLGVVVIMVRQGPAPRRVRELSNLFGVHRATITRWQTFWRDHVPSTPFSKLARARWRDCHVAAVKLTPQRKKSSRMQHRRQTIDYLDQGTIDYRDYSQGGDYSVS
jgi:hypothetical protein